MKTICELVAGSKLYGLDTIESDTDTRGVFLNTNIDEIIGLKRFEIIKKESIDSLFFEFRHFLKGMKKTNTQMIEMVFANEEHFAIIEPEFVEIRKNKLKLIDSEKFFKSLMGYIENEKRLANGERTGKLGSKRRKSLEKYGFSPKNFSHLLRLSFCGSVFFETDFYPVDLKKYDTEFRNFLFEIKTTPEKFNKNHLNILTDKSIEKLKIAFDSRKNNFVFDEDLANEFCYNFYMPFLRR